MLCHLCIGFDKLQAKIKKRKDKMTGVIISTMSDVSH